MEPNKNADWSEEWWDNNYGITGIDNGCISNKTTTTCDLSNEECEWSILAYILNNPNQVDRYPLAAADFWDANSGRIYIAIKKLIDKGVRLMGTDVIFNSAKSNHLDKAALARLRKDIDDIIQYKKEQNGVKVEEVDYDFSIVKKYSVLRRLLSFFS